MGLRESLFVPINSDVFIPMPGSQKYTERCAVRVYWVDGWVGRGTDSRIDRHADGWMGGHGAKAGGEASTGMTGAAPWGTRMSCRGLHCPTGPAAVGGGRGVNRSAWQTSPSGFRACCQWG